MSPARSNAPYQTGFANHFATEAVEGALPVGRNSPQRPALGLYAEQLSGAIIAWLNRPVAWPLMSKYFCSSKPNIWL